MSDLVERLRSATARLMSESADQATIRRNTAIKEAAARITELEAENARLREALNEIARQPLAEAMDDEDLDRASFEDGYDYCVRHARAALAGQGDGE